MQGILIGFDVIYSIERQKSVSNQYGVLQC